MNKSIILLSLIILSCSSDDNVQVSDPKLLIKDGVLTGCTDDYANNKDGGISFDDNSCNYSPQECSGCDFIVELNMQVIDNEDLQLPAGSVIGIKGGDRNSLIFRNFHGTVDNPFIFINCDSKVNITAEAPAIKLHNLSHVRLTGTGSNDEYGIKISKGRPFGVVAELGATDFEIDHIEITNIGGPGISARTRPVCDGSTNRGTFIQQNTIIHHNYLHNIEGEGMYIGGSHWHSNFATVEECPDLKLLEPELEGVKIYNNILENIGLDGIQVGSAITGSEVYNNLISNYGLNNVTIHQAGIQINPGTTGSVFGNLILNGTGSAIFLNGFDNKVFSNLIINCKKDGIHVGDREPPAGKSYVIVNNTLHTVGEHAIYMNSKLSINNIFYNNLLIDIKGDVHNKLNSDISLDLKNNLEAGSISEVNVKNADQFDYTPNDDSPLIDAGIAIEENLVTDFMLNKRLVGMRIDIGAVEYQKN